MAYVEGEDDFGRRGQLASVVPLIRLAEELEHRRGATLLLRRGDLAVDVRVEVDGDVGLNVSGERLGELHDRRLVEQLLQPRLRACLADIRDEVLHDRHLLPDASGDVRLSRQLPQAHAPFRHR